MSDKFSNLMTEEECNVYSKLSEAWNLFIALEVLHSEDRPEFARAINAAKNILMSRPVAREMQEQNVPGYTEK